MTAPTPMAMFEARCWARALLWWEWALDLHTAVDELQASAEQAGLISDYGQDAVQQRMSDAFGYWRRAC